MLPQPKFNESDTSQEYWGDEAAGCIFLAKDTGRILLGRRSEQTEYEPGTWGTWGEKIDNGETPKQTIAREVEEETGYSEELDAHLLNVYRDGNFSYHNFLVMVPFEFTPQLNWENDNSGWFEYGKWPEPLHFGMEALIKKSGGQLQKIIHLLKIRKDKLTENSQESVKSNEIKCEPQGMIDIATYGYKWITPYGYLSFGFETTNRKFILYMVQTKKEFQNQGHSKELLDTFFQLVKRENGVLTTTSYTMMGMAYAKHIIDRLAKQYGVRLV